MSDTSLESRVTELEKEVRRQRTRYWCTVSGAVLVISLLLIAEYYQGVAFNKALEAQIQTNQALLQINQRVSEMHAEQSGLNDERNAAGPMHPVELVGRRVDMQIDRNSLVAERH